MSKHNKKSKDPSFESILQSNLIAKSKARKAKYNPGTANLKKGSIKLKHNQAFYDKKRKTPRFANLSNERIQKMMDNEEKRKKRSSQYKRGSSEKK